MEGNSYLLLRAVKDMGFSHLTLDLHTNKGRLFVDDKQVEPVFIRFSRSSSRFENERFILTYIAEHLHDKPSTPRLLAALPDIGHGVLLLSYEEGYDVAAFLADGVDIPPLVAGYDVRKYSGEVDLTVAFEEMGRVMKRLHSIDPPYFGKLVGDEPNPHRSGAQAFTRAEVLHALQRCGEVGWLDKGRMDYVKGWVNEHVTLVDAAERPRLVHYDMHAGNIRFCQDGTEQWRFRCFLDFELARAWLPEYDLAILSWYVRDGHEEWWEAFLQGYGDVVMERLALFEVIKMLQAMAYTSPNESSHWGHWCLIKLMAL